MINAKSIAISVLGKSSVSSHGAAAMFEIFGFPVEIEDYEEIHKSLWSQKAPPSIAILNLLDFKDHDALDLLKKIRQIDWVKPTIFLIVEENSSLSLADFFRQGADGVMFKPLDASVIRDLVQQSCLSRKQRWMTPFRKPKVHEIKLSIDAMADTQNKVIFGRGGFRINGSSLSLKELEAVSFYIELEEEQVCRRISGSGQVLWTNRHETTGLLDAGIEIKYLDDLGRDLFIQWSEASRPVAFIP